MFPWLNDPQANYVLGAYGVASVILLGILAASLLSSRVAIKKWQRLRGERFKGEA